MRGLLRHSMARECNKHVERHFEYLFELDQDIKRKTRRLGTLSKKTVVRPFYWDLDDRFDPFKTRIKRKLDSYSYTLARKIARGQYVPKRAVHYSIEKEDGSPREVCVFQLPDAAVSTAVYKSLLQKNKNRLSAYSYAYREDVGAHDAVHDISADWRTRGRVYVAEFDFSKFFDQINHSYLLNVLDRHGFLYTKEERQVIEAFLHSESASKQSYTMGPARERTVGIPQGSSISLFLANIACWELDRALEKTGVRFSRYADDTLIWSDSYERIVAAYGELRRCGESMQVPINLEKSKGISLLAERPRGEIVSKEYVEYLGYRLTLSAVSIKQGQVDDLKKRISYIVYQNLLQPLKRGIFNRRRLRTLDWDYIVALDQIRRYLYGGLNDEKLRKYIRGQLPQLNFRGLMSYYPVVSDRTQLSKLDGWLIYILRQSLRLRERLWVQKHGLTLPGPRRNWIEALTDLRSWASSAGEVFDLRVPSFQLINEAMQIAITRGGIQSVASPVSVYYS